MKFQYKLQRLCGAYYGNATANDGYGSSGSGRGSNVCYDSSGTTLITAVSNRVQLIDLKSLTVRTLPIEARSNIACLCLTPDDALLLVVDVQRYAMLVNVARGIVLHRMRFGSPVKHAAASPCGRYLAVTSGVHVQAWSLPTAASMRSDVSPLVLHRTYTGQTNQITSVAFSKDSSVLLGTSKDGTVRIWTVHTTKDFQPVTLSGHKSPVIGAYLGYETVSSALGETRERVDVCYTISEDGTLATWKAVYDAEAVSLRANKRQRKEDIDLPPREHSIKDFEEQIDDAVDFFSGDAGAKRSRAFHETDIIGHGDYAKSRLKSQGHELVHAVWSVKTRHYFRQDGATAVASAYSPSARILSIGFSSGIFGIYELPSVANIHTLSVGTNQRIQSCALTPNGEWLALACPSSQQLLVWEWQSETYVLKQRGHAFGMRCFAYSPDGVVIATGGEDGKLKMWNSTSGFCYVTIDAHQAPITAVAYANASVVLSSSLDGTVRAHDLHRYRTFKTLTTPTPVQFISLAVDPSGELVTAGTMDPFHVYCWNLQTAQVLDVLTGHKGPVCSLAYSTINGTLASASWDGTVQLWDLYKANTPSERLTYSTDVVCVAYRPDGKEIATGTIAGLISIWDVESSKLKYEIDGRRDISGGRKLNDRQTANNNAASRYFTSICYSADGTCLLAGGNSKFVCVYEVSQQILLKKFQVTFNRSLDGVLDELNSKNLTEFGVIDNHADPTVDERTSSSVRLPGAKRGDDGSRTSLVEVLTHQVAFSSTGREWAAISGEGLHVYSLDEDLVFDPISLTVSMTPAAVESKLSLGEFGLALRMALHLNEYTLVHHVLEATPFASIAHVVRNSIEPSQMERLIQYVSKSMESSPHVEFYLQWCLQLLQTHGQYIQKHQGSHLRALRSLYKIVQMRHGELQGIGNMNKYNLEFVQDQARLMLTTEKEQTTE